MVYPGSGRRSVTPYVQFVVDSVARAKLHRGEYNGGERGPVPKSRVGDEEDEAWLRAPRVCACVGVKAKMKRMDSKSQPVLFYRMKRRSSVTRTDVGSGAGRQGVPRFLPWILPAWRTSSMVMVGPGGRQGDSFSLCGGESAIGFVRTVDETEQGLACTASPALRCHGSRDGRASRERQLPVPSGALAAGFPS